MPLAVFRADASPAIGGGHVMRSLALAGELTRRGWRCAIACNEKAAQTVPALQRSGHEVRKLAQGDAGDPRALHRHWPGGADLLAVDHYGLNAEYESACRPWARHILAIDDLASRNHDADLLLDQTPGRMKEAYAGLVAPACTLLLGSEFALLRPEFAQARDRALRQRSGKMTLDRLFVSVGATDPDGVTGKALDLILSSGLAVAVDVMMGGGAPQCETVERQLASMPSRSRLHVDPPVETMVKLMIEADLAVGGAGVSALERCCLGLPSLLLVLADNQRGNAEALQRTGAARLAGIDPGGGAAVSLRKELLDLGRAPAAMAEMSRAAFSVCDGLGAGRVATHADRFR